MIENSITGGPSEVFVRYSKLNETKINAAKFGDNAKICKSHLFALLFNSVLISVNSLPLCPATDVFSSALLNK